MKKLSKYLQNLKLRSKIWLVLSLIVFLLISTSIGGLYAITNVENQLVYQTASGSLQYSAKDISTELSNMEHLISLIVSNSYIRRNLITLNKDQISDESAEIRMANAKSSIEASISDFHRLYKNSNINFINIYSNSNIISSYKTQQSFIPNAQLSSILRKANEASGYPIWITDYCDKYGMLYLARNCTHVEDLKFHTLGTVIIGINMQKLIKNSTSSVLYTDDVQYILLKGNQPFYHTNDINREQIPVINNLLSSDYALIPVSHENFFGIRGVIENNNWKYICLIPYSSISKTINLTIYIVFSLIILVLFIANLISHYFTKSINNEFMELTNKMNVFAESGTQFAISTPYVDRQDEIGILHKQFNQMALQIQTLIQQNYVNEILVRDARLQALKSQINPHFLYNTLETVNWRAKAIGEKDISSMVESLGMLLRETLSKSNNLPTLEHELEIVRNYLTIQKIRFEDRFDFFEEIDSTILNVQLPHLTLQPLVENAIHYAIEENTDCSSITIKAYINHDSTVVIEVTNTNSQFPDNLLQQLEENKITPRGFGIGLLNIHQRLQIIYGSDFGLTILNPSDNLAAVKIIIPGGSKC